MSSNRFLLEAKGLTKSYRLPRKKLFKAGADLYPVYNVDLAVKRQKNLGIAGESGAGKSTLARILAQLERQDAGEVFFEGQAVSAMPSEKFSHFRKAVQFIFQDPYASINPKRTIFQTLVEPLIINKIGDVKSQREKVSYTLNEVGLSADIGMNFPHQLSGGQRQRVAIARSIMLEPKLVIADEPVSALDVSIKVQILNLLLDLQTKYDITYIVISHDLAVLRHFCDDVLIYYAGQVIEQQPASSIFEAKNILHPYTAFLFDAAFVDGVHPIKKAVKHKYKVNDLNILEQKFGGCNFYNLCPIRQAKCQTFNPELAPVSLDARNDAVNQNLNSNLMKVACHYPGKTLEQ